MPALMLICCWNSMADIAAAENRRAIEPVQLTAEEREWLAEHPFVKIGVEQDWVPFEYFDSDGRYNGISARVMRLVEQYTGLHFEPVTGPWPATMKKFRRGEISMLPAVFYDKRREEYGIYTSPYYIVKNFIFVTADNQDIHGFSDLSGRTVALPKGWTLTLKLKKDHPDINIIETATLLDALIAVINRRADATIASQTAVYYLSQENTLGGLKGIVQTELARTQFDFRHCIIYLTYRTRIHKSIVIQKEKSCVILCSQP
jgi:ABC-type amino acid transport substrate-binding protein